VAQALGLSVGVGKDYQSTVASAGTAALVRGLPLVMQVPQWLDAFYFENPHAKTVLAADGDVGAYFGWASGQMTNFMRRFPNDPDSTLTQRQRKFADQVKGIADEGEGDVREKQLNPP
jgi:hypothetical protein